MVSNAQREEVLGLLSVGLVTIENVKQFKSSNNKSIDTCLKYKAWNGNKKFLIKLRILQLVEILDITQSNSFTIQMETIETQRRDINPPTKIKN